MCLFQNTAGAPGASRRFGRHPDVNRRSDVQNAPRNEVRSRKAVFSQYFNPFLPYLSHVMNKIRIFNHAESDQRSKTV